ncbi:MAG: hypothetical protein MUF87_21060 [Anaerolineae bacterium]|jgi:hypothetical protein|nr:hypothetical protein [Anaerolineae bacterium]
MNISKPFALKLLIFITPFVLILSAITSFLILIGESMPLTWVIQLQMSDAPVLYRPQHGNRDLQYKSLAVNLRQPEVIAIGSSRVLQMRAGLLTEAPPLFYNAGAPAWRLDQIDPVIRSFDRPPRIIMIGIDPVWFHQAYQGDVFPPPIDDLSNLWQINRGVLQTALTQGASGWTHWLTRAAPQTRGLALGIKAIENGHGFRNDGSEQYGDFLIGRFLSPPIERDRHLEWMRNGQEMYLFGDESAISPEKWAQWLDLLRYCQDRGITVIAFSPPFAPSLYHEMQTRGQHTYLSALATRLAGTGVAYFDFADGANFGRDDDFFDGWHGSEHVYLRLFREIVRAQPELWQGFSTVSALDAIDQRVTDTWRVFD